MASGSRHPLEAVKRFLTQRFVFLRSLIYRAPQAMLCPPGAERPKHKWVPIRASPRVHRRLPDDHPGASDRQKAAVSLFWVSE